MRETTDNRRQEYRNQSHRRRRQARPGCRIAVYLLQQLRKQHNRTEVEHIGETDTQAADGKVSRLKQRQIDYRVIVRQLPDNQEAYRDHCHDGQHDNLLRGKPVQLFTAVQHDLQATDAHHQQCQAHTVNASLLGLRLATAQRLQREQHNDRTNRYIDKEDPAPVIVITDKSAENRSTNRCDDNGHRPQRQRDRAFGGRIVVQQQTLRQRNQRPRHNPLNDAEEDQHRQAIGHPTRP
ncbi:hypothetical protein D3C78_783180 [compost metagenome]